MAGDALKTLVRVRKIRERQAEMEWAAARAEEREQAAIAEENQRRFRESLDHGRVHSGEDLARGHLFALHLEVGVRHDLSALEVKRRKVAESQVRAKAAQLSRRVVESAHETNVAKAEVEALRPVNQALDEMGIAAWWRRRSS